MMKKLQKTARKKRSSSGSVPQLPDEIVWEIPALLPVKPLLRFKTVSKAWRATISDTAFIRAQLQCSAAKCEHGYPSFLISPNSNTDPNEYSDSSRSQTSIRFYRWTPPPASAAEAEHLHTEDLGNRYGGFRRAREFAHCDGLVLAPTDTALHVFNPATRDVFTLPHSDRNDLRMSGKNCCYCAGIGLDPTSGMYKVVQAFCRPVEEEVPAYYV